jgi:hypothetical protein
MKWNEYNAEEGAEPVTKQQQDNSRRRSLEHSVVLISCTSVPSF